ncbi:Uncharacterised protein [Mycobacteroides abscessus subsp. abscessus]|nr:Uncharacterised protein [Mycobacteroides abscessus subsp. abscessus]
MKTRIANTIRNASQRDTQLSSSSARKKKKKKLAYRAITPATISRAVPAPAFFASSTNSALASATSDRNSVETLAVAFLTRLPTLASPDESRSASLSGIDGVFPPALR